MKTKAVGFFAIALGCLGFAHSSAASIESRTLRTADVALQGYGLLIGQVVNTQGQAVSGVPVVLASGGKEIARCITDKTGTFRVAGLKGGTIEVVSAGVEGTCRVWAPGTAPPAAQKGLLVVAVGETVRGQHVGGPVASGFGGGRGRNGLLATMIEHPLVTAGAVGAAIAIPIAVSNTGSPASP